MAREFYATTAQVISAAARGLGLVSEDIADPFTSTDRNVLQMLQLLADLGQELAADYDWQQLRTSGGTVDLSASGSNFGPGSSGRGDDLPADFGHMAPDAVWNRTTGQPLFGPVSAQEWAEYIARGSTFTAQVPWRIWGDLFASWYTATETGTVVYEYYSRYWIRTSSSSYLTLDSAVPAAAADVLCFDRRMLIDGLKLRFAEAKGMPAEALQRHFDESRDKALAHDMPGRTLSLVPSQTRPVPILPDGGWGS